MKTIILVTTVFLVSGITMAADSNPIDRVSMVESNDIKAAVMGNRQFSFNLYKMLKDNPATMTPQGNMLFSPYSVSICLAMVYSGARGDTQRQMAISLYFNLPSVSLAETLGTLQRNLIQEDKSRGYQFLTANALWGQKGEPFIKEFLDLTQNYYDAGLYQLDFVNEPEPSRKKINSWIEKKTKNKIKELVPLGGIDRDTVLVLTNAIYFKGEWRTKFSRWKTKDDDFTVSANQKVRVPFMHLKEDFKYCEDANLQVLEMPYKNDEISMIVILPNKIDGLNEIEKSFTDNTFNALLSKMQEYEIDVFFPKFKMRGGTFSLRRTLKDLGMSDAFEPGKADFSGINGKGDIWISDVFQKTFIEVNEEGTEATAATSGVMTLSVSPEPFVFRANHPFIFIIKDNRSGSILFMGRLMNPAE